MLPSAFRRGAGGEVFQKSTLRTLHALLIPEATNREPRPPAAAVPAYNAVAVDQAAVPGACWNIHRRTPPVAIVANAVG